MIANITFASPMATPTIRSSESVRELNSSKKKKKSEIKKKKKTKTEGKKNQKTEKPTKPKESELNITDRDVESFGGDDELGMGDIPC